MKKCPFCAEEIRDEAIVCRYCGRDIKTKAWSYRTYILHFRNADEAGWITADNQPPALICQHFFNKLFDLISEWDRSLHNEGWEITEPRSPGCIQIEHTRSNAHTVLSIVSVLGGGNTSGHIWKAWPRSCTLRYKKLMENGKQETWNYCKNLNLNKWERVEQDAITQKWHVWRRPLDFDKNNPNDERWDKIPL